MIMGKYATVSRNELPKQCLVKVTVLYYQDGSWIQAVEENRQRQSDIDDV